MKLKKIVSLALAGILAVSMLTACGDNSSSSSETKPEVTPVTGTAASINAELDENKDKITFTDNANLKTLLTDYYSNNVITAAYANSTGVVVLDRDNSLVKSVVSVLNASSYASFNRGNNIGHAANSYVTDDNNTKKVTNVEIYVLNSEYLTESGALKIVGQSLDELDLPEEGVGVAAEKDYSYTGSVAAIEAKTDGKTESVWVVAVTITQTPSGK